MSDYKYKTLGERWKEEKQSFQVVKTDEEKKAEADMRIRKACKPKGGEKKSEFVSRCIRTARHEGKSQDEAAGMCYGIWENAVKAAAARTVKKKLFDTVTKMLHSLIKRF